MSRAGICKIRNFHCKFFRQRRWKGGGIFTVNFFVNGGGREERIFTVNFFVN